MYIIYIYIYIYLVTYFSEKLNLKQTVLLTVIQPGTFHGNVWDVQLANNILPEDSVKNVSFTPQACFFVAFKEAHIRPMVHLKLLNPSTFEQGNV